MHLLGRVERPRLRHAFRRVSRSTTGCEPWSCGSPTGWRTIELGVAGRGSRSTKLEQGGVKLVLSVLLVPLDEIDPGQPYGAQPQRHYFPDLLEQMNRVEGNGDVADVIADNLSHENAEAITDPLGMGWVTTQGYEVADQCEETGPFDPNSLSPTGPTNPDAYLPTLGGSEPAGTLFDQLINGDHYFTQTLWSNAADNCCPRGRSARASPHQRRSCLA